jgi:site-specific DNA-methyltransferase (adenine-specific)
MVALKQEKNVAGDTTHQTLPLFQEQAGDVFEVDNIHVQQGDAAHFYATWDTPTAIVSDGAYGLGLFPGDPKAETDLIAWYEPHVRAWTQHATPQTTLWFWNSELGWATVHSLLAQQGWQFVNCHVWDKGLAHIAGNSNTKTLRKFPVVSEVCVQYVKAARIDHLNLQDWLRREWKRSGLPFSVANKACDVKNAATRKYLTGDHLWYFPPPDAFEKLAQYANEYGEPAGQPYFSQDGINPMTATEWAAMRSKFTCKPGVTNVWQEPPLSGTERIKIGSKSIHLNQKPLKLMELIIESSTDKGDTIWEPFGGLCSAAVAAHKLGRRCFSAELDVDFFEHATRRLRYDAWKS